MKQPKILPGQIIVIHDCDNKVYKQVIEVQEFFFVVTEVRSVNGLARVAGLIDLFDQDERILPGFEYSYTPISEDVLEDNLSLDEFPNFGNTPFGLITTIDGVPVECPFFNQD